MADNVLETKIQLRYGTYSQWMNSNLILLQGEAAICAFPRDKVIESLSNSKPDYTPPAIGIKIGDGVHYFRELPWVQAISADVYTWAKSATKPTYTAQEIQGLQAYVESLVGGDVEVNIAPRIYQIVQGTGDNVGKYYLRYKENNDESDWITDTSSYIDISNLSKVVNWLGTANLDDYPNLITRNAEQIRYFLNKLSNTDSAISHKFVTSVSETDGVISVERAQPTFSDINGTANVSQGGTGRSTLTEDAVLVGNGTNQVKLIPIAESIANNNHLVPNNIVKAYIDQSVAGLSGAMHFIGDASVVITNNSNVDPRISGYNFSQAQPGDVILYDYKEFVWTGAVWRLLGDEGSYAIKGSIKDADIDAEAEIQQSKIAGLSTTFNTKVDKVEGKSLTSNDFTDEYKEKLDEISSNAQQNAIEHIYLNNTEVPITTVNNVQKVVNLEIDEFDDNSRSKLEAIEADAQVNKIERIIFDGQEITPTNKTITITSDPHTDHINVIEGININGTDYIPDANKKVNITIDQAALKLDVIAGARVPSKTGNTYEDVDIAIVNGLKRLELSHIAKTGLISDALQSSGTYMILNCGSSTTVV